MRPRGFKRIYATGYRVGEVPLPRLGDTKRDLSIRRRATVDHCFRVPMQSYLGGGVAGCALPMPCADFMPNCHAGVVRRFGGALPPVETRLLREFRSFVRIWLRTHLPALRDDELLGFEEWVRQTHYSDSRRNELRRAFQDNPVLSARHYRCKSFPKRETYATWKYQRLINSRSDAFKAHVGPFIASVEHAVFATDGPIGKYFCKKIPVDQRSDFIYSRLHSPGALYQSNDFESFESSFTSPFLRACELQLYTHMARNLGADTQRVVTHLHRALASDNHCTFKRSSVKVDGCRMSGDMCTSLGNGFSNLMLWLFFAARAGIHVDGVVEGDDGIFRCSHLDGSSAVLDVKEFGKLGFRAKCKTSSSLGHAGFCKMFFADGSRDNVADPAYRIASSSWTHSALMLGGRRTLDALLRAKGFSLLAMLPACPILTAYAKYLLRAVGPGKLLYSGQGGRKDYWEHEMLTNSTGPRPVEQCSRIIMEDVFGVSTATQLSIENYLDGLDKLQDLTHPDIINLMRHEWFDYSDKYSWTYESTDPDLFFS